MKRVRGAYKGCKCCYPAESREGFECMAKHKPIKAPPKTCEMRIEPSEAPKGRKEDEE